ncbi:MAG TPA: hypothetical protein VN920_08290, partial [Pyrinomonadaceae bacterium]|nr:hypothetical protein [Pyrinomonadaceae bacterium]
DRFFHRGTDIPVWLLMSSCLKDIPFADLISLANGQTEDRPECLPYPRRIMSSEKVPVKQ